MKTEFKFPIASNVFLRPTTNMTTRESDHKVFTTTKIRGTLFPKGVVADTSGHG